MPARIYDLRQVANRMHNAYRTVVHNHEET
jgi:hypothetical protein